MSSIPSWARVGAKVVCTKRGEWSDHFLGETAPAYGQILTIREVCFYQFPSLLFVEIVNEPRRYIDGFGEKCWSLERFKPLITIEDDISTHFAALLHVKQPSTVTA